MCSIILLVYQKIHKANVDKQYQHHKKSRQNKYIINARFGQILNFGGIKCIFCLLNKKRMQFQYFEVYNVGKYFVNWK